MADIFISYSRKDSVFARRLYDAIKTTGRELWIDWEDIPYSADWWHEICAAIDAAENFVFIISPDSLASEICNRELRYAHDNLKRIIPVMHRDINDKQIAGEWFEKEWEANARENWTLLKTLNWLFFRDSDDFEKAFQSLVATAAQDPAYVRLHTRLLVRAREWEGQARDESLLLRGSDLHEAENWLIFNVDKQPVPTDLHRTYINASTALREGEEQTERERQAHELTLAQEAAENARRAETAERSAREAAEAKAQSARRTTRIVAGLGLIALLFAIAAIILWIHTSAQANTIFQEFIFNVQGANDRNWFAAFKSIPVYASTPLPDDVFATATAWAVPLPEVVSQDFNGVEMVQVPAGCFLMGSDTNPAEQPVNKVCFDKAFWLDRFEVSNQQFADFKGKASNESYDCDPNQDGTISDDERTACLMHPRENISWFEARDFCVLRGARLPTEAEWEYAARGPREWVYPWGNDFIADNVVYGDAYQQTAEVGSKPGGVSWVGAYDMAGNVWEWVNTISDQKRFPYPYNANDGREDNNDSNSLLVMRGGSWNNVADSDSLRSANRSEEYPFDYQRDLGVRCARDS